MDSLQIQTSTSYSQINRSQRSQRNGHTPASTNTNPRHRHAHQLLNTCNVIACSRWQFIPLAALCGVRVPARQCYAQTTTTTTTMTQVEVQHTQDEVAVIHIHSYTTSTALSDSSVDGIAPGGNTLPFNLYATPYNKINTSHHIMTGQQDRYSHHTHQS